MSEEAKYKNALPPGFIMETGSHKYRIDSVIEAGGFGITYRATNLKAFRLRGYEVAQGVPLAIKECYLRESASGRVYMKRRADGYVELMDGSEGYMQREAFFNEGRCLLQNLARIGQCDYMRFVPMYHAGWLAGANSTNRNYREPGILFLVMPYLSGGTLKEIGSGTPGEFVCCMYELLRTLEILHAGQVYHRDIKPANIMLDEHKRPVLIDFGLSGDALVNRAYTKGYASPEQFRKENNIGAASDIYSLGVSFYELLSGVRPVNADRRLKGESVFPLFRIKQVRDWLKAYGERFEQLYRSTMKADYAQMHGGAHFVDMLLYSVDLAMELQISKRFPSAAVWRQYVFGGFHPYFGRPEASVFGNSSVYRRHSAPAQPQSQRPVQLPVQPQVQPQAQLPQLPVRPNTPQNRVPSAYKQPAESAVGVLQQGLDAVRRAGEVVQGVNNVVHGAQRVAHQVGRVAHNVNQVAGILNQVAPGLVPPEYSGSLQQGLNAVRNIGNVAHGVENFVNAVQGNGRSEGLPISMQGGAQLADSVGNVLDKLNLHEAAGVARDARNVMNAVEKGKQELERLRRGLGGLFGG